MKVLFAIMMTMTMTATAFGACSADSAKECTTKEACEGLNPKDKDKGPSFVFDAAAKGQKCTTVVANVGTDCIADASNKYSDKDGKPADGAATKPGDAARK